MKPQRAMELARLTAELSFIRVSTYEPQQIANDAYLLITNATRLHHYAESACNYGLSKAQRTRIANIEADVKRITERYGIEVAEFNGDPRGYAVYLKFPSGISNSWSGQERGWGI
jgi:hypothetical protein